MASPIQTAAVLFLVVAGVFGADVDLGGACTPGTDTCVHTSLDLTCDKVFLKCVIKDGQTCTGAGHGGLCVFGATCDSGTSQCKCASGVYTATNGLCENSASSPLYGGDCSSPTCDATSSNLECRTTDPKVCVCKADFKLNPATGKCDAATAAKIGHSCTVGTANTCDAGSTCDATTTVCSCDAGKSGMLDGTCDDIASEKNGAACGTCGSNAACTDGFCVCNSGYTAVVGGDCVPSAGKVGGGCSGTSGQQGSCADSFALCTTTGQGMTCTIPALKIGHTCTASTATTDCGNATTTHLECSSTTPTVCVCSTGYSGPTGGDCAIPASKIGHTCTASTAATDCGNATTTHLKCSATAPTVCVCSTGYSGPTGGDCAVDNGASSVVVSATAVLLAAALGLLISV